jgi:UDP-N-acetylmuramyl pentapeptide phosphotransferase/UDP-N-acetylglucosamine-1-phosphate transferase
VFDLPRTVRYAVHFVVAAAVVHWAGHPGAQTGLAAAGPFVVSVVFVTGLINAFNFMDGIDALVGGTGVVIVAFLAWVTRDPMWILLAASYAGFLVFNLPPARIFMGDAGSTALGGLIGVAILSGQSELVVRDLVVLAPLMLDSAYTIARRLIRRENIFRAHHSHIYQRLLRAGHSHTAISGGYAGATLALGGLAIGGNNALVLAGLVGCVAAIVPIEIYLSCRDVSFTRSETERRSPNTPMPIRPASAVGDLDTSPRSNP